MVDFLADDIVKEISDIRAYNFYVDSLDIGTFSTYKLENSGVNGGVRVVFTDGSYGLRLFDVDGLSENSTPILFSLPLDSNKLPGLIPSSTFSGVVINHMNEDLT
jgi:hypothetical protein